MLQHTLKSALQESLWYQAQARETAYIQAQEAARAFALKVHAVSARYAFAPATGLFRFTPAGVCTQAALTLTDEDGETLTVIARIEDAAAGQDAETVWFLADVSALRFDAAVYIAAVQARLEANKSADRGPKAVN